jgi:hypothetical protein
VAADVFFNGMLQDMIKKSRHANENVGLEFRISRRLPLFPSLYHRRSPR